MHPPTSRSRPSLSLNWYLAALLVLLSAADLGLTVTALQRGATELNPVMSALLDARWATVAKPLGIGLVALSLLHKGERGRRPLVIGVVIFAVVVLWNGSMLVARY